MPSTVLTEVFNWQNLEFLLSRKKSKRSFYLNPSKPSPVDPGGSSVVEASSGWPTHQHSSSALSPLLHIYTQTHKIIQHNILILSHSKCIHPQPHVCILLQVHSLLTCCLQTCTHTHTHTHTHLPMVFLPSLRASSYSSLSCWLSSTCST